MALKTYADWEHAVRVARVVYDHSKARMVCKRKTVRKSKIMAFLSAISVKESGGISSTIESSKTSPPTRRKSTMDVKKSKGSYKPVEKKKKKIQIFIATPLASTICLQLNPSTSISAVKELLQDRLGIDPEKQHLFMRNEMELCDALSLEDHCIHQDTNIELRLIAGLMGGGKKKKSAKKEKPNPKPQSESPTSRSDTPAAPAEEGQHGEDYSAAGATARDPQPTTSRGNIDINVDGNQNRIEVEQDQTNISENIRAEEGEADARLPSGGSISSSDTPVGEGAAGATAREQPPTTRRGNKEFNIKGDKNRVRVEGDRTTHNYGPTYNIFVTQNLPRDVERHIQDQPMPLTREPKEPALLQGDERSKPTVRPEAPRIRDKSIQKEKRAATGLRQEDPEATTLLQQSDKPKDYSNITDQQQHRQLSSQAVDEEGRSREPQAKEKHKREVPPGDGPPSTATTNEAKLRILLTGDESGELDQSFYPVLIANKPATPAENDTDAIARQFGFIKTIRWTTVLDFNSQSKVNGLCKLYHDDRMVSLQQPELFKDIESDEEFRNTIEFPEKTVWVFANGREDDQNIQAPKMTLPEWHKERRGDVEDSVRFFSKPSVIPKGRAVIMFLLLSEDDIDILCDTFGKLSSSFQSIQSIVCIAEDRELYSKFVNYVTRWFSKDDIDKRSLVGLEWQEINRIMMRMNGVNQTAKNELPSKLHGQCFLSEKQKDEWYDITVVCKNECENTDMDDTSPSYQQFVKRKELDFYHGEKVDWWNFAIGEKEKKLRKTCGHVLKRKCFGDVLKKVRKPLESSKSGDSLIVTVTLLHQPGAGGSTLARNVLWELHKDYRCVEVNRVTSRTVNQIMEVRQFGYGKEQARKIPPVCVLVDNLDDVEVLDLIADLEEKSKHVRVDGGAVCVVLHCKRNADPLTAIKTKGRNPNLYIPLTYKLSQEGKEWCQQKYIELEHKENEDKKGDYIPDNLLAFMVMKEEFNKEYITGVVSRILPDIKGNELKLIKLCALLNSYIHEADIPISCCDTFMAGTWAKGKTIYFTKHTLNWEKSLSAPFKSMMVITENRTIKILHKSIAEEALRQTLRDCGDQSLADVTLEFLNSELLQSSSYSRKILAKTTHDLLIRRERVEDTKTGFSVLIEEICEKQGSENAIKILTKGVEILKDAFVAQQLARFYLIKEKNFDMAHTFADKALENYPQNSYFWDTKGRVYKAHFDTLTEPYILDQQPLSDEVLNEVLSLSFEAMKTFRKSYEVSKESAPKQIEYTGLYAELNMAFRLLQVIHLCVEPFRTQGDINVLKMYLLKLDLPPCVCLPAWDSVTHTQVRELKNRVDEVLEIMDGKTTYYKDYSTANIAGQKLDQMMENMKKYSIIYNKYYGEPQPMQNTRYTDTDPISLTEHRRRLVDQLHCGSFREIFDRAKAKQRKVLEESRDLLRQNSSNYNSFDLKNLICIHLALSSFDIGEQSVSADYVYQEFVRPFYAMDRPKGESCWPSLLMTMFLWPIKGVASARRDRYDLTEHIMELKRRWDADGIFSHAPMPQVQERIKRQIKSQMKPRTHFFLGQGEGLRVFTHITELHATQGKLDRRDAGDDSFWQSDLVKERLVRLEGTLLNATSLLHRFHKDKDPIDIKLAVPYERLASQESVTFYLGFSWNGPVAYDVTLSTDKEGRDDHTVQPSFHQAYPNHILPSGKSKVSPSDNLSDIDKLQLKREELKKKIEDLSSVLLQDSKQLKRDKDESIRKSREYKRQLKQVRENLRREWQLDDSYDVYSWTFV
ncbi:sterile alpha motif domain-containing protein 9-like [Patiria miniata]|uniref:Ubiquitin-like domain-containing protein n=1 Tax=Patiria miniata TaxID=46514 RepID=A0A913Z724_PATMI|nr:sterile alpha motif domain-containing protein 9-like [Patiria miniata]